jgi:hypothetical protein
MINDHDDGWEISASGIHIADISFTGKIDGFCLLFTMANENMERPLIEFSGNVQKQETLTYKNRRTGVEASGREFAITVQGQEVALRDFRSRAQTSAEGWLSKLVRLFLGHKK